MKKLFFRLLKIYSSGEKNIEKKNGNMAYQLIREFSEGEYERFEQVDFYHFI